MDEIISSLGPQNRVLDLGAGPGSFNYGATKAQVIALDVCYPLRCQSDADRIIGVSHAIPLGTASVDVVICNHTLEHFENRSAALLPVLKAFLFFKFYNCPCCGKKNLFSRALEQKQS